MERTPEHLPAPMMEMLQDLEPSVEELDITPTTRGERMVQPAQQRFADPLGGTPVGAFSLEGATPLPAPAGFTWDHDPDDFSDLPDEVADLFSKIEQDEHFSVTPQRQLSNGQIEDAFEFKGYRPTKDEIGTKFGPGTWRFSIGYRPKNWGRGGGRRTQTRTTPWFVLSEEAYRLRHEEYLAAQQDLTRDRLRTRRELDQARYGHNPQGDLLGNLQAFAGILSSFQRPPQQDSMATMLPMLMKMNQDSADRSQQSMTQMMVAMSQAQAQAAQAQAQSQTQMMTIMMTMMQAVMQMGNESANRMVSIMGSNTKDSSLSMFKELTGFMKEGIQMSRTAASMLSEPLPVQASYEPEERDESAGLVSVILQAIPSVLQSLSVLNSVPAVARGPMINAAINQQAGAQGQQAYEAMRNDKMTRLKSMVGFVRQFGPEQIEEVLKAMLVPYTQEELAKAIEVGTKLRDQDLAAEGADNPVGEDDADEGEIVV